MKELNVQNLMLLYPSLIEWRAILNTTIAEYDQKPFLKSELLRMFIKQYLDEFGTISAKTIAVLEEVKKGHWWPKIVYFPKGVQLDQGEVALSSFKEAYIYVYYRTFHCFDCGLDADAFCLDRDAYIGKTEDLNKIYDSWNYNQVRCPRCSGDFRNPGLIEIHKSTL